MSFARRRELLQQEQLNRKRNRQINFYRQRHANTLNVLENETEPNSETDLRLKMIEPYPNFIEDQKEDSIFVSVASYRDPECLATVADLFVKARYPGRVFVGICQQNYKSDLDCEATDVARKFKKNIRVLRLTADEAKGPMYARALIETQLYEGEMYYLVIDSHSLFVENWDVELIRQLALCDSEKPVLTCYPEEYDIKTRRLPDHPVLGSYLSFRNFHPRFGFSQQDPQKLRQLPVKPVKNLFWAAGFSFTLGSIIEEVPYDIHCRYIFLGEEISMAARMWTSGWDFFCPMTNVVFHYTPRDYRPTFWEQYYKRHGDGSVVVDEIDRRERKQLEKEANARLHQLLDASRPDLEAPYGLGKARSFEDFQRYIGLNFRTRKATRNARRGLTADPSPEEMRVKLGVTKL